jgi:Leucine-rich repeat (LRR) protein/soluble cytochrome b562
VISKNSLNQIDDWLQAMPNLKSITATQNRINSLPSNIAKYSLVELILPRNALTSSAISIIGDNPKSNLGMHLTCIDLSGNNLEWFSSSLAKLPLLSTLAMSRNRIQTLAAGLENGLESGWREGFQALEMLDLSCNKISDIGELPRCLIEYCPRIRDLSLSNNELAFIPPDFCVLQSLTFLDLRGNPQRAIRPGVLDRSTPEILSYLQSRIDSEKLHKLQEKRTKSSAADGDKMNGSSKNDSECKSNRLEELRKEIDKATLQLNNVHLTEAKKYAIKKSLKTLKASLIKEERHIRMEAGN